MKKQTYLSIIIPAYKESKRIPETLKKVSGYLKQQSYNYEIVVVNDGSPDNTAKVVKGLTQEIENLRLIDNKENHGKGYVVRQGLLESRGQYRVFMDADNSTSVDHVEKMFPQFEKGFDVVIGSRDIEGAKLPVPQGKFRIFVGDVFNLLVQFLTGLWGIKDTQCGFKGFTKECVEKVVPQCKIDRFAFDPEILIIAKRMGYKIKEIPVTWYNDPNSTVGFSNMINMAKDLFRIRLNIIKGVYEKKES
jgi:dolichyl-phosphate beta-glucosyltransferase